MANRKYTAISQAKEARREYNILAQQRYREYVFNSCPFNVTQEHPLRASLAPLEHVTSIDQALNELLASIEDPCVQKSLQDPIARIDSRFKDLVNRVHRKEQLVMPTIHYSPHASAAVCNREHNMLADTIASLSTQVYRYRAHHMNLTEIKSLSAQLMQVAMFPKNIHTICDASTVISDCGFTSASSIPKVKSS
ncbi:hypothetical protein COCCADRAFT_42262 [Bipolaris zeicola 26-R-13]|uniref:Uncharacterized protein n=1 Tax=Cochliobolus carbonum (strain 26-R-13) TaxID=930089 RepID=W6XI60_COCC2|nr:uncharacterized protein COCCADRAFT_42262 [Bipolaris zeicola 26-R-13]EUC26752.1 hypothetical protein COCCADRAFT_42262 [Bipolaris zeicola 26-R-13]